MAMTVLNNSAAQISLGELNKSINKLGKALAVVASGQKINGAKDDSAAFAISEVMREKIRSLEQDVQNVQNGASMLKTAEGGIQQQIDLLRTVREKVIDANNDSNTDDDRRIIQKEINQLYDQMEQVAYYTEYNTKKILLGDTVRDFDIVSVPVLSTVETTLEGGDAGISGELNLIDDVYKELDGITAGPFDMLKDYGIKDSSIRALGVTPSITIKAGDYTATPFENAYTNSNPGSTTKITNWDKAAAPFMNNRGFTVTVTDSDTGKLSSSRYVITSEPGQNRYQDSNVKEIDISGCSTVAQVMARIDDAVDAIKGHSGNKITVDQYANISSWSQNAVREATASNAGPFSTQKNFSGAVYDNYWQAGVFDSSDRYTPDRWHADSSKIKAGTASDTFDVNNLADNSGFTVFTGSGSPIGYVRFVDGPLHSDANTSVEVGHQRGDDDVVQVSKDYLKKNPSVPLSFSAGSVNVSINNGTVTLSAGPSGGINGANTTADKMKDYGFTAAANINKYYVRSGISAASGTSNVRIRGLGFDKQASDATFDLSALQSTEPADLERFISDLAGKAIKDNSYGNGYNGSTSSYTNSTNGYYYEFIDSASDDIDKSKGKIYSGPETLINLHGLRGMVGTVDANGHERTIADAFADLMESSTRYVVYRNSEYQKMISKNYMLTATKPPELNRLLSPLIIS